MYEPKTMNTLFARSFFTVLGALLLLLVTVAGVFMFGINRSIRVWNVQRTRAIRSLVQPAIAEAYREEGDLDEETIYEAVVPFLRGVSAVQVLDRHGDPVFHYSRGERLALEETGAEPVGTRRAFVQISDDQSGETIGYLAVDTAGFTADPVNRAFIEQIITSATTGATLSFLIALLVAYGYSRSLSARTGALAAGLRRLADGDRDVPFNLTGILELREIAESAERLEAQLAASERQRTQWAQDISHDLRTPITALKSQFEAMVEGVVEPSAERVRSVYGELLRVEKLVRDLTDLSYIESPQLRLDVRPVLLPSLLRSVVHTFEMQASEREIEIAIDSQVERIEADEHLLNRALGNIVQNAVRYGTTPGKIRVSAKEKQTDAFRGTEIRVANVGYVAPEEIPRLIERLYRRENSRPEGGSGLGLSIAAAVVRLHGGELSMSQEGEWTVVSLTIPEHPGGDGRYRSKQGAAGQKSARSAATG